MIAGAILCFITASGIASWTILTSIVLFRIARAFWVRSALASPQQDRSGNLYPLQDRRYLSPCPVACQSRLPGPSSTT